MLSVLNLFIKIKASVKNLRLLTLFKIVLQLMGKLFFINVNLGKHLRLEKLEMPPPQKKYVFLSWPISIGLLPFSVS